MESMAISPSVLRVAAGKVMFMLGLVDGEKA
jgi:hypothetical protein